MKLANRILVAVLALVAGLSLVGCGKECSTTSLGSTGGSGSSGGGVSTGGTVCGPGNIGGGNSNALVYYLSPSTTIAAAGLTASGTFAPITITSPTLPSNGSDNMVIVNKQFLYISMGDSTIQAFAITRSTGSLTAISGNPFSVTSGTADSAVSDPQGRFLFVGDEVSNTISAFQINSTTGALTPAPGSPFTPFNLSAADILTVDGSGKFLYVGQGSPGPGIAAFSIDQTTGALTQIAGSPFNLGVAQIHADPSGKFLLGVAEIQDASSGATDTHISVFSIDPVTGVPTAVSGSPFATTFAPFDFAIHPGGKFVYTFGVNTSTQVASIEGFQLDTTTGMLTALSGSPFSTLPSVSGCQFDQSGAEAFCIDALFGSKFFVLTADSTTGALTHTVPDLTVTNNFPFAATD